MEGIGRNQTIGPNNPRLVWFVADGEGYLAEPDAIDFQVWSIASLPGTKVVPAVGEYESLNLVANALGTGRYAFPWVIPADADQGLYKLVVKVTTGSEVSEAELRFEILQEGLDLRNSYCLVSQAREEGVLVTDADDARLAGKLADASRYIDTICERTFSAEHKTLALSGKGGHVLFLDTPIIFIESVDLNYGISDSSGFMPDQEAINIFNRHITNRQLDPDDRDNPMIEFEGWTIERSKDAAEVIGVFGYTDPLHGGPAFGVTPGKITEAAMRIAFMNLPKLMDPDEAEEAFSRRHSHLIRSESTGAQSYSMGAIEGGNPAWTGDPDIDTILAFYKRPIAIGSP